MEINRSDVTLPGVVTLQLNLAQYLERFSPKPIEQQWLNDFSSMERRDSAQNLLNLLGSAVRRNEELRGVEIFRDPKRKDAWGNRQTQVLVRFQEVFSFSGIVSIGRNIAEEYQQGKATYGEALYRKGVSGPQSKVTEGWYIPLPEDKLLQTQVISGPRPLYEIVTSGGLALRSDIETALNMVGCHFQDSYYRSKAESPREGIIARFLGWRATSG